MSTTSPKHDIPSESLPPIDRLKEIARILRSPGGCPWDIEQTHETLIPCLLEEAYEVTTAIQKNDTTNLREELGDLLLQPIMHAQIASEQGTFTLDDIAQEICEKLIRRHPHVFGNTDATNSGEVLQQWDEIKKQEKGNQDTTYLDKTGEGLPSLLRAKKISKKVAKIGFDWPDHTGCLEKIEEELQEVKEAIQEKNKTHIQEELGDLLFSVVNLCRKLDHDPESILHATNEKFIDRFGSVEQEIKNQNLTLETASLDQMELAWNNSKQSDF